MSLGGAEASPGHFHQKHLKKPHFIFLVNMKKGSYGVDRDLKHEASIEDFMFRKNYVTVRFFERD